MPHTRRRQWQSGLAQRTGRRPPQSAAAPRSTGSVWALAVMSARQSRTRTCPGRRTPTGAARRHGPVCRMGTVRRSLVRLEQKDHGKPTGRAKPPDAVHLSAISLQASRCCSPRSRPRLPRRSGPPPRRPRRTHRHPHLTQNAPSTRSCRGRILARELLHLRLRSSQGDQPSQRPQLGVRRRA